MLSCPLLHPGYALMPEGETVPSVGQVAVGVGMGDQENLHPRLVRYLAKELSNTRLV
jgi:hypothetical protein